MPDKGTILHRKKTRVPTPGSQRRCYNGCFAFSDWEMIWSDWGVLERNVPEDRLTFWVELQEYSVSIGGAGGSGYRWEPDK